MTSQLRVRIHTHLAEEPRIQPSQLLGQVTLIHVVEVMERSTGGETLLHQLEHSGHA